MLTPFYLLATAMLISCAHSITVYTNNTAPLYFNSPPARYGIMDFNISNSPLVLADPIDLCSQQSGDFTGKIVVATHNGCSATRKIQFAIERGAIAILSHYEGRHGPAGNFYWKTTTGQWAPADLIPYLAVNGSDGDIIRSLLANSTNGLLVGDLDPNENNEWKIMLDTSNRYLTAVILLVIANAAGLGFALSRLISLIATKGCLKTTSHFTLSFICAGHTSTIIYFTINIIDIKTGPVAPEVVHNIFLIFPELFQMLSSLIVSLFWFELITSSRTAPTSFVKKLSKPFVAFAIIISVLFVILVILSGFNISDIMILIFYLVFVAISLLVATIWIIVGTKMIRHIQTSTNIRGKKASNYRRLSALIIVCAVFLLVTRMLYLWLGLDPTADGNPSRWIVFVPLIFFFQLATAFIQTGLFKFHKRDFKTSSNGSNKTSKRMSVGGTSLQLRVAGVTKGDSAGQELVSERVDSPKSESTSSSRSNKVNGDLDDQTAHLVDIPPSEDLLTPHTVHDTRSKSSDDNMSQSEDMQSNPE